MVTSNSRGYGTQLRRIKAIFEDAGVPKHWYSINEPFDCRISIVPELDGIHVFIPERGERVGEQTYDHWYDVIAAASQSFGPRYQKAVMDIADRIKKIEAQIPAASIMRVLRAESKTVAAHDVATANQLMTACKNPVQSAIKIGDTVRVYVKVVNGAKECTQTFEGTVIAKRNSGIRETFTIRRVTYGVGVERTFPFNSPRVERIDIIKKGKLTRVHSIRKKSFLTKGIQAAKKA